ncbi:DUF6483 family protein [Desulfosporosinus youngiae]|uniref:Uncharacterized protein n=1 Tax=Desulfosporosinus youngiae DSM 17734 TaxID=768710 RepID=H5XWF3_9FIRM|nr:DUF6483 family protein [Desulfosporosinus youngiae]EHQ90322.1 hypothetical protein DesyoDRAFT_3292 [Desulfosporosinus youngiae DSM 17734]
MYQKDYIIKMIKQLTLAVATLLSSKSKTKIEECQQMLNGAIYDLTGMSEHTILKLSHRDLISIISGGKEINTEKCFALAEMLKLSAEVSEDDTARSFALYLKSLNIFIEVSLDQRSDTTQNKSQAIHEIINVIKQYKLPKESNLLIFRYYEFNGRYDKAEDVLFNMIKTNKDEIVDEGFAFYERLRMKTQEELESGNLPLDEVIEGLNVYRNLLNH